MKTRRVLIGLFILLAIPALAQAAPQRNRLANGLAIVTSENHEAPVVSFQVWVKAGSAHERSHEYGITHLIEHMIFKGTPSQPVGSLARRIEALGGEVNAYTTLDHTNYYVTVASRYADEALRLLADAVVNASFDPQELTREKEVVIEEIRMGRDNPDRRRGREAMALAFGDHPYGRPVIGSEESVRAITRDDILAYRDRWYRSPNMAVVAVGDFDTTRLLPQLAQVFAPLSSQPAPEFSLPPVSLAPGPRLSVMREKVNQAALVISWQIPGLPSDAVYPLDVAAEVAGGSRASRLWRAVKEEKGLVDAVGVDCYTPAGLGLFEVEAQLRPDQTEQAWPELIAGTLSLAVNPPSEAELNRARVNAQAQQVRNRQTMQGQASLLGYFELLRGGYEKAAEYLDRFKAVTSPEVAVAARAYFRPEGLSVVIQVPEDAPAPDLAALQAKVHQLTANLPPAPAFNEGQALRARLANDMTLIVKPQRAVPLMTFTLAAPGGQLAETPAEAGLYQLWSRAVTRGTTHLSYDQLTTELEDRAASLRGFAGKSSAGLTGSFLAQDWRRGLELMAEVWLSADFPADQVARAKAEQLAILRAQEDQPTARAFKALRQELYGQHPYAQDPLGSPQTLAQLGPERLRTAQARLRGPGGLVLSVVGDVDPEAVAAEVGKLLAGVTGQAAPPQPAPPLAIASPRVARINDPQAQQTQVLMAFQAPAADDPRRFPMQILDAILGGQGGRLFTVLRDQQSLAYAVQPFYTEAWQVGAFGAYLAVGPAKATPALAGLETQLELVRRQAPTPAEVERARNYLLGSQAIELQGYGVQAMTMAIDELLGLGFDNHLKTPAQLQRVDPETVRQVAAQVLDPQHRAQVTLGP